MVESRHDDSQELIRLAAAGDQAAAHRLLELHRGRLRAMIAIRLDRHLSARVGPSDVLKETLAEAHQKFPEYLRTQPSPSYPWLRRMAWEKIVHRRAQHLLAQARAVTRDSNGHLISDDLGRRSASKR